LTVERSLSSKVVRITVANATRKKLPAVEATCEEALKAGIASGDRANRDYRMSTYDKPSVSSFHNQRDYQPANSVDSKVAAKIFQLMKSVPVLRTELDRPHQVAARIYPRTHVS
jgi:hypothetical protein